VKFSSDVSIQIFSLKNANPSFNEIHVENDYFPLLSKFEMWSLSLHHQYGVEWAFSCGWVGILFVSSIFLPFFASLSTSSFLRHLWGLLLYIE
jgi:hypothetical protein